MYLRLFNVSLFLFWIGMSCDFTKSKNPKIVVNADTASVIDRTDTVSQTSSAKKTVITEAEKATRLVESKNFYDLVVNQYAKQKADSAKAAQVLYTLNYFGDKYGWPIYVDGDKPVKGYSLPIPVCYPHDSFPVIWNPAFRPEFMYLANNYDKLSKFRYTSDTNSANKQTLYISLDQLTRNTPTIHVATEVALVELLVKKLPQVKEYLFAEYLIHWDLGWSARYMDDMLENYFQLITKYKNPVAVRKKVLKQLLKDTTTFNYVFSDWGMKANLPTSENEERYLKGIASIYDRVLSNETDCNNSYMKYSSLCLALFPSNVAYLKIHAFLLYRSGKKKEAIICQRKMIALLRQQNCTPDVEMKILKEMKDNSFLHGGSCYEHAVSSDFIDYDLGW